MTTPSKTKTLLSMCITLIFAVGCGAALPHRSPESSLKSAIRKAEKAAEKSEEHSVQVREQLKAAERLVIEARELLQSAENSHKSCEELVKRVPKPRRCPRVPKCEEIKKEAATRASEADPEFSQSDAPM